MKEGKEDEESFLSQVCEMLCSSDCTLLVMKLFNMLHSKSNYTPDVLTGGMTSLHDKNHYGHRQSTIAIGEGFFNIHAIALQKFRGSPSTHFVAWMR